MSRLGKTLGLVFAALVLVLAAGRSPSAGGLHQAAGVLTAGAETEAPARLARGA